MNPSDTHIERMADVFATRVSQRETPVPEARTAWRSALTYARGAGVLERLRAQMQADAPGDARLEDAWADRR